MKKARKKIIMFFISLLIIAIVFFTYLKSYQISKNYSLIDKIAISLFDKNDYQIDYTNINCRDIKIFWHSEIYNMPLLINENGKFINGIKNSYGKNIFDIYYKDELYFHLSYFKTNRWFVNSYNVKTELKDKNIVIAFDVSGPDSVRFEFSKPIKK